jgi:hypothetical protein
MAIEIVDFPSYKMVIFHSYVTVYQRVWHEKKSPFLLTKQEWKMAIFHGAHPASSGTRQVHLKLSLEPR